MDLILIALVIVCRALDDMLAAVFLASLELLVDMVLVGAILRLIFVDELVGIVLVVVVFVVAVMLVLFFIITLVFGVVVLVVL